MRPRYWGLVIGIVLALVPVIVGAAALAEWVGADPAFQLVANGDGQHADLAVRAGQTAVVWAGRSTPGIYLGISGGSSWTTTTLTTTAEVHHPVIVYSGTRWIAVWVQGVLSDVTIMSQDQDGLAQAVVTHMFGEAFPQLKSGPTGQYLTFAASTSYAERTLTDLYLSHRPLTATTWATAIVVTRTQVIPGQTGGGVWNPRLALSPDGLTLHLVWQQTVGITRTVWYLSGTWIPGGVMWGSPQQVSPSDQSVAVLPDVAATADQVYVTWTEVVGGVAYSNTQYINLWRLGKSAVRVSPDFYVNNVQPTWAASTLDAQGQQVCFTWHANVPGVPSGEGKEEVWLQCSKDGGATWMELVNVSESPVTYSLNPRVELDASGRVALVWTEVAMDQEQRKFYDVYYRIGPAQMLHVYLPLVLRRS